MPDRDTSPKRRFWASPAALLALAVGAAFLATSAARIAIRARAMERERRAAEERMRALEAEVARLEAILGAIESPEAVERLAKEQLNLKRPGEEVVVVPRRDRAAAADDGARTGAFLESFLAWLRSLFGVQ